MRYSLTTSFRLLLTYLFLFFSCVILVSQQLVKPELLFLTQALATVFLIASFLLAIFYKRIRNLSSLILVALAYLIVVFQVQLPTLEAEPPIFALPPSIGHLLLSLMLPILFTLNSLWAERSHPLQDFAVRLTCFFITGVIAYALAASFPAQLHDTFTAIYFPSIYISWLAFGQIPQIVMLICLSVLFGQLIHKRQVFYAAQLTVLLCLIFMLKSFAQLTTPHLIATLSAFMLSLAILQEAFYMAFIDDLTKIPGRRALNERMQRLGSNYFIAMSDIDHFKKFNDTYGHDNGDTVLNLVAQELSKVGKGGKTYRYGGEEFTLVFGNRKIEEVTAELERLRQNIENLRIPLLNPKTAHMEEVQITLSLGLATAGTELRTPDAVLKAADEALYAAKKAGRNQLVVYGWKAPPKPRAKRKVKTT